MQITEIKKDETFNQYLRRAYRLRRRVKRLGAGGYAHVFQHPFRQDVAVKVYEPDEGYNVYLKWAIHNQNNPYAITVYRFPDGSYFKTVKDRRDVPYTFVLLKKYVEISAEQLEQTFRHFFPYYRIYTKNRWEQMQEKDWQRSSELLKDKDPYGSEIAKFFAIHSQNLDLASFNMMWDPGKNTAVFTDPFAV
jgi:hypothetical protein